MKQGIHPNYVECAVTCACGHSFTTRSTKPEIHVDICSHCHPFFTGQQKLIDSAGRIEQFKTRFASTSGAPVKRAKKQKASAPVRKHIKTLKSTPSSSPKKAPAHK